MGVSSRSTFYPYYIRPGWREHDRLPLYDPIELNHNGECGNLIDRMAAIFLGRPGELYKNYGFKADFTAAGNTNSPIGNGRRRGYWGSDQRSFATGTGGAIVLGGYLDSNGALEGDGNYGARNRSIFCKVAPARNPITHNDQIIVRCGDDLPMYIDNTGTSGRLTIFSANTASKAYAAVSSDCYSGRFIHALTSHGVENTTTKNQAWTWRGDGVKSAGSVTGTMASAGSLTLCLPNGGTDVTIGHLILFSFGSGPPLTDETAEPLLDIRSLFKPKAQVSYFIMPGLSAAVSSTVSADSNLLYRVRQLLAVDGNFPYTIKNLLAVDVQLLNAVRQVAAGDAEIIYATRQLAAADVQLLNAVRQLAASDAQFLYEILNLALVHADLEIPYAMAGVASSDVSILFGIRALVNASSELYYRISELTSVDLEIPSQVKNLAAVDVELLNKVAGLAPADLEALSAINGLSSSDLQLLYSLAGVSSADLQLLYRIGLVPSGAIERTLKVAAFAKTIGAAAFDQAIKAAGFDQTIKAAGFDKTVKPHELSSN